MTIALDKRRNAWITRVGGKLKTLCPGPENSTTKSIAWDEFYKHLAALGRPTEVVPETTLGELADEYGAWMQRQVDTGEMAEATMTYYVPFIQRFLDAVGGQRPACSIPPLELEKFKTNRHSVQTVKRLFNWGMDMGLIEENPFRRIQQPEAGQRSRILTREELARLIRAAQRPFNFFLVALFHTIARPQELRALQWKHLVENPDPAFVLTEFKAKKLRKEKNGNRVIPVDGTVMLMLRRFQKRRNPAQNDFVFLNQNGEPWTGNAVRCRMRRLRDKLGFGEDESGEKIVAYTLRHSGATYATIHGIGQRALADVMGHSTTDMTQRYQHLKTAHLHRALNEVTKNRRRS